MFKFFRSGSQTETSSQPSGAAASARLTRRSNGLAELTKSLVGQEPLSILDLGPTSPKNIAHITGLGHRIYNEDVLLASMDPAYAMKAEDGSSTMNVDAFLADNLKHPAGQFDAVLCWDIPDYLHESLVKPAVERIASALKPGGMVLAFFHTKDAGPDAPYYRYHIAGTDTLELQRGPQFRLQRVFNNRHIENLFRGFANIKFFLGRDNIREILVVR